MARLDRIAILAYEYKFCFKVDLKTAFHQIRKKRNQWPLQGIFVKCSDFDLALFDTTTSDVWPADRAAVEPGTHHWLSRQWVFQTARNGLIKS